MTSPLEQYPEVRRVAYIAQWIINLALGIIAVVLTILGTSPTWYVITTAVFNFVWTYTGLTAQGNTPSVTTGARKAE